MYGHTFVFVAPSDSGEVTEVWRDARAVVTERGPNMYTSNIFILCYAPAAIADDEDKDHYYKVLKATYNKFKNLGIVYVARDINARIQVKPITDGDPGGPHTFDKHSTTIRREPDCVLDNRERFIGFCDQNKLISSNTDFEKPPEQLANYRERKQPF